MKIVLWSHKRECDSALQSTLRSRYVQEISKETSLVDFVHTKRREIKAVRNPVGTSTRVWVVHVLRVIAGHDTVFFHTTYKLLGVSLVALQLALFHRRRLAF